MTLFQTALDARKNAYAPYSNFKVGAAVRSGSGKVFGGCNVENVSSPEGTCAEAGAIAAMIAAGETEIAEILVVAGGPVLITPCGGCRQKIAEFSEFDTPVVLANPAGETRTTTVGDLLPGSFDKSHLQKG